MARDSAVNEAGGTNDAAASGGVLGEGLQQPRNADGLTFDEWEEASWAAIDAMELELGDDALALQRKAKARRRRERNTGQDDGADKAAGEGVSGWLGEQTLAPQPPESRPAGLSARAPVTFGLAKKKPAKVRTDVHAYQRNSDWHPLRAARVCTARFRSGSREQLFYRTVLCAGDCVVCSVSRVVSRRSGSGGNKQTREWSRACCGIREWKM
jgi:hypothetical protein